MRNPNINYRRVAIFVIYSALVLIGYHLLLKTWLPGHLTRHETISEYRREFSKLGPDAAKIRIDDGKTMISDCPQLKADYFSSQFSCITFAAGGIKYTSRSVYDKVSADLLKAMRANGWQVANQTEYRNSKDHLLDVAYYKNDGDMSCNLKISSDDPHQQIFINAQICGKTTSYFDVNLSRRLYGP